MPNNYLQAGRAVKMEIQMQPHYFLFEGTIEKVQNNLIIVGIEGRYIQKSPKNVKCTIPNKVNTTVCMFETIILDVMDNKLFLQYPLAKDIHIFQRRQYVRVPENIPVNCYLVGMNDKKIETDKSFLATIKDISGGGVLLNSPFSLPVGTILTFEMELEEESFILTVSVLRNVQNRENNTRDLGCEYIGIDEGERQKIIAYCSKKQLLLKKEQGI